MTWRIDGDGRYNLKVFLPCGKLIFDVTGDLRLCWGVRQAIGKREGFWCLCRDGKWLGLRALELWKVPWGLGGRR